jgi:hypothetical protein
MILHEISSGNPDVFAPSRRMHYPVVWGNDTSCCRYSDYPVPEKPLASMVPENDPAKNPIAYPGDRMPITSWISERELSTARGV